MTVEENIEFFGGVYGVNEEKLKQRRDYVLKMAGLEDKRGTMTRLLSGGWKQRLALGCAILHEPPILFLDEPTSGVDPIARRDFWDLIHNLARAGHTVFVSTHYMDEAEYCGRRGRPGISDVAVFGSGLHVTVPDAPSVERLREILMGSGIEIRRLERIEPS